jgi:hypothetical protein
MKRAALLGMLVCSMAAAVGRVPAAAARDDSKPFLLAVLNRDGYAMPFAAFDGRRWKSPWPDYRAAEMPISIDDVDKDWWGVGERPQRMALWFEGTKIKDVTLAGLAMVKSLCSTRLGIKTDYKPAQVAPPRTKAPYPKDGLLVSGDTPVERIEIVSPGSAEFNRALIFVTDKFNKRENVAALSFTDWRHPFDERRRKAQPITVEAMYRAPNQKPGWTTYYIEAVRQYPARPIDAGCGLVTVGDGWVHVGPKDELRIEFDTRVTYCDRKGVGVMLPLGFIRVGDHNYWVAQFSGFEYETYRVIEPEKDGARLQAAFHAGSCPD